MIKKEWPNLLAKHNQLNQVRLIYQNLATGETVRTSIALSELFVAYMDVCYGNIISQKHNIRAKTRGF